jgi:hypothetical protein
MNRNRTSVCKVEGHSSIHIHRNIKNSSALFEHPFFFVAIIITPNKWFDWNRTQFGHVQPTLMPKAIFIYMNWQKRYRNWISGEEKFHLFPCKIASPSRCKWLNVQPPEIKIQQIMTLKLLVVIGLATIKNQITWPLRKPAYDHSFSNSSSFTFSLFSEGEWTIQELLVSRSAVLYGYFHIEIG